MAERWKCVLCSFVCLFLSQLLSHLNTVHRNDVNFYQKCGLPGCSSKTDYTSTNSFIKHVRTSHHALLNCTYDSACAVNVLHDEDIDMDADDKTDCDSGSPPESDSISDLDSFEENILAGVLDSEGGFASDKDSLHDDQASEEEPEPEPEPLPVLEILDRFCLKIREEAMISSRSVEKIRSVTVSLLKATAQQSKSQVNKVLKDNGIDPKTMPELEHAFLPSSWEHGSCELNDNGNSGNICFPNISPREILLGKRRQWKRVKNRKSRIVEYPERFYYISLLASLEVLLNNRKSLDMVASPKVSKPDSSLLCDFTNGSLVQTDHDLFSVDPQSLKVLLYYDDVEITNEHTKRKHKLSMFYFQLANLYPEYRSKLKSINLLAIVEYRYLKKYGIDVILAPFVEELQALGSDTGVDFQIEGGIVRLWGALLAVIADTPASQLLGGYKESVGGAKRKCRHCMTDFEEMQSKFTEDDFVLRSEELHKYHILQLEENKELHNHFSKEYGVNKRSTLLDAPYFNVTEQLPQDVMHVILEGSLSRTLFFVIRYFLDNNICSLQEVNAFILNFHYGYSEVKDKPVCISAEDLQAPFNNLGQTAAQIWLLSRVFAFFGAQYANNCPDVWRVLMTALEITGICLSRKISVNILGYLKGLIKEHLQIFKDVFQENITPKQHYLIHLPSQILKFGPIARAWAMRFEGKHQLFKKIPKITKNFKNLPKTLAERHQSGVRADSIPLSGNHAMSAEEHPLFQKDFTIESGSTYTRVLIDENEKATTKSYISRFYPTFGDLGSENPIYQASSATVHGTCYKKDLNTILLAEVSDVQPVFGSLEKIWLCSTYIFFGLKLYETVEYSTDLNAYQIKDEELPSGLLVIEIQDLLIPSVMHVYKHDQNMYICPREDPNAFVDN